MCIRDSAISLLKGFPKLKFSETVDISINLGIDTKKSDQNVRGSSTLPHGIGKPSIVVVFAEGEGAAAAKKAGADKVSINSAAIQNQQIIQESSDHFGSQCIVVAVDVKKIENDWIVYSHGGTINTNINAFKWLEKVQKLGAGEILLTSMDKDGTKSGFDIELLKVATNILQIPVIASGGVGAKEHFFEGVFEGGASALLAASVFHFNEFSIKEVKQFLSDKNIKVRL